MTQSERLLKLINQLKNNIKNDPKYNASEKTFSYIWAWVVGGLEALESKINGGFSYYPPRATRRDLFRDFKQYFYCERIAEEIKAETLAQLMTDQNKKLVEKIEKLILR